MLHKSLEVSLWLSGKICQTLLRNVNHVLGAKTRGLDLASGETNRATHL